MNEVPNKEVIAFYDEHPLNEAEILSKLRQAGRDPAHLQPEHLFAFDQDHYGGTEATDALTQGLGLTSQSRLLDVCSGLGGSSRYLAHRYGCQVLGIDLNRERTASAVRLTAMVGLAERVSFAQGDATQMELPAESFDAAIGQEAFLHIWDKTALFANCHGALKTGGRLAFTDWIAFPGLTGVERERLREGIAAQQILLLEEYRERLAEAGFRDIHHEDLSAQWRVILRQRLEMFKSLKEETVRNFGAERHERYIAAYTFFVDTIGTGRLGGGRFFAVK